MYSAWPSDELDNGMELSTRGCEKLINLPMAN